MLRRSTRQIDPEDPSPSGRPARVLWGLSAVTAIVALWIAGTAAGILESSDESLATHEAEPRLDASVAEQARRHRDKRRPQSPSQENLAGSSPRNSREPEETADEEPLPDRVLKENARLRRDLEDLEAIEKEQARVRKALSAAAASYDGPLRLGAGGLAWPVNGPLVSPFGQRWGRLHAGIDIAAPAGTVIRAAANGAVAIAGPTGGYGNYVCLQHTATFTTCYAHLSRFLTEKGVVVRQGEPIGLVGCTGHCFGDHLHFETRVGGSPVDPMRYL